MVPADGRDDSPDSRVSEHFVDIVRPVLRRVGNETPLTQGMGREPDIEAKSLQALNPTLDAVRERARSAPGRAYDGDRIAGP